MIIRRYEVGPEGIGRAMPLDPPELPHTDPRVRAELGRLAAASRAVTRRIRDCQARGVQPSKDLTAQWYRYADLMAALTRD